MQHKGTDMPPIDLSDDLLANAYKKWKEGTSTSPSGCHLGHYKALLKIGGLPKEKDNEAHNTRIRSAKTIFSIHCSLVRLTLRHCHAYSRWHRVHNIFFDKDRGQYKIHRLRVIHIMEVDWQAINKIIVARGLI